eukprot:gnl/Trimastix_PCT/879.p2 GENE.gnl/Trimastix_PCT/879~~gnl/Trimastix_PCT/879.p2  ORF type:complete len:527 (+),score=171.67 gnl/Trimastix_PCT/879:66-1583(+)
MSKAVIQVFEEYQRSRITFVQNVAELALRPQNIEILNNAGVMSLLRPLLLDVVPSVQQSAALALGRLANHSDQMAEAVVSNDIIPQLVCSLGDQNRYYKKAAAFVLRAVAKHSPQLAQSVVESGALEALVECLNEFDPSVKEAACWALGNISRHHSDLAQAVVDANAVQLTVLCLQEPELPLKRIAAATLADIAKHSPELAQHVADHGAIAYLAPMITSPDSKLKRNVCSCLAQIAKHSLELAELVVEAEIFPRILNSLKDVDIVVRKNGATCIREIAKHTPELAQLVVNAGGVAALVDYANETTGHNRLPGIMCLGYIAAFSEPLALAIIVNKGIQPLVHALVTEPEDYIKSAAAWSLGQIGRHTPDHARALADANVLPKLLAVYMHDQSSDDLVLKAKRALKAIIQKCVHLPALEPLLHQAPPKILRYIVAQYAKVLPSDRNARKQFVALGGLQRIQELNAEQGTKLKAAIDAVNSCYPEEVVRYYSPGYSKELMQKIDEYNP